MSSPRCGLAAGQRCVCWRQHTGVCWRHDSGDQGSELKRSLEVWRAAATLTHLMAASLHRLGALCCAVQPAMHLGGWPGDRRWASRHQHVRIASTSSLLRRRRPTTTPAAASSGSTTSCIAGTWALRGSRCPSRSKTSLPSGGWGTILGLKSVGSILMLLSC